MYITFVCVDIMEVPKNYPTELTVTEEQKDRQTGKATNRGTKFCSTQKYGSKKVKKKQTDKKSNRKKILTLKSISLATVNI